MTTIRRLFLRNFRNHEGSLIDFEEGVNLIIGPNAAGKTSLLEALHLLISGRSFRTHHLSELIRWESEAFQVEVLFVKNGVEQRLGLTYDGSERRITYNNNPLQQLSGLLGIIAGVTLTPYDIELIQGAPKVRRQFLDLFLTQLDPLYLYHLSRFHGAMKRRNLLLRRRVKSDHLEPFEILMQRASIAISRAREEALKDLATPSLFEELSFEFHPSIFDPSQRKKEEELGFTLTGPHKEDFTILLNKKEAKAFASEGQKRSAAMTLKIAQYTHYHSLTGDPPLLCIDDVGMGFDANRVIKLASQLTGLGQVFLSSCQQLPGLVSQQIIEVEAGIVQEQSLLQPSALLLK